METDLKKKKKKYLPNSNVFQFPSQFYWPNKILAFQRKSAIWLRELKLRFCNNLAGWEEWEVGRRFKREGTYIHLWLIHVDVWQKPKQYYKAIII